MLTSIVSFLGKKSSKLQFTMMVELAPGVRHQLPTLIYKDLDLHQNICQWWSTISDCITLWIQTWKEMPITLVGVDLLQFMEPLLIKCMDEMAWFSTRSDILR